MKVGILLPTYNRANILVDCIHGLARHLKGVEPVFYVGVDGNDRTVETLQIYVLNSLAYKVNIFVNNPRLGLGANLNKLIRECQENFMMQMDDDHVMREDMDLTPHISELGKAEAGWIRLYGIGAHKYHADLRGSYWYIDWNSPELYIPSNRPHLKHKRFHEFYGLYPEGRKLGQTEEGFCHQCIDKARATHYSGPNVLVPLNSNSETAFDHVGSSYQLQGE